MQGPNSATTAGKKIRQKQKGIEDPTIAGLLGIKLIASPLLLSSYMC